MGRVLVDEQLLERARRHQMTPEERQAQRVSWAYGVVGSTITEDQVTQALEDLGEIPKGTSKST